MKRIILTMCLSFLISCKENNCIHFRRWKVVNPIDNSFKFETDTFKVDFIKELRIIKSTFDSLISAGSKEKKINDNRIHIEAKSEVQYKNKLIKVYRVSSWNNGVDFTFLYCKEYGILLKYVLKKQYVLDEVFTSCNENIEKYGILMEKIKKDSSLMSIKKIVFENY